MCARAYFLTRIMTQKTPAAAAPAAAPKAELKIEKPVLETDPSKNPYYDPSLRGPNASARTKRALQFHDPGTFVRQAEALRAKVYTF